MFATLRSGGELAIGAEMKQFACGDVVPECDARWVCDTDDEILAHVAVHAREVHGLDPIPPEVVDRVRSLIAPD